MTEPTDDERNTMAAVLATNIASARAGRRRSDGKPFQQQDLADRMRGLGWKWVRQTVGEVEKGTRRLTAEEVFSIALALDTTVDRLMRPIWSDKDIVLPNGFRLPSKIAGQVICRGDLSDQPDDRADRLRAFHRGIHWDGNSPVRVRSRHDDLAQG